MIARLAGIMETPEDDRGVSDQEWLDQLLRDAKYNEERKGLHPGFRHVIGPNGR
jgi:hypothetical protein